MSLVIIFSHRDWSAVDMAACASESRELRRTRWIFAHTHRRSCRWPCQATIPPLEITRPSTTNTMCVARRSNAGVRERNNPGWEEQRPQFLGMGPRGVGGDVLQFSWEIPGARTVLLHIAIDFMARSPSVQAGTSPGAILATLHPLSGEYYASRSMRREPVALRRDSPWRCLRRRSEHTHRDQALGWHSRIVFATAWSRGDG